MNASEILTEALNHIQTVGWHKGSTAPAEFYGDPIGSERMNEAPLCAWGAVYRVATVNELAHTSSHRLAKEYLDRAVQEHLNDAFKGIIGYNDLPETTLEDVVARFHDALDMLTGKR